MYFLFSPVGSPHTWPSVLAMLDWLIDVIDMWKNVDAEAIAFPEDFDSENRLHRLRFETEVKLFHCDTEQKAEECLEVSLRFSVV